MRGIRYIIDIRDMLQKEFIWFLSLSMYTLYEILGVL